MLRSGLQLIVLASCSATAGTKVVLRAVLFKELMTSIAKTPEWYSCRKKPYLLLILKVLSTKAE